MRMIVECRRMCRWEPSERAEDSTAYQYDLSPTRFDGEAACCLRPLFSPILLLSMPCPSPTSSF